MTRSFNHRKGDNSHIKKNKSGSKAIPRKEWRESKLKNRFFRRNWALEQIRTAI